MKKGKNFFYRIDVAELAVAVMMIPEGGHKEWLLRLVQDLASGNGTTEYSAKLIEEVEIYREKQSEAGKRGGRPKKSDPLATLSDPIPTLEQPKANNNSSSSNKDQKPSPRKKPSGDHAVFTDWWCFAYEKLAQRKYAFVDKKDGASVKFILSQFPLKDAIAIACHFLLVEDKFFQGKRDLGMMRANINRLPAPERCDIATARAWGILPPSGVMFEDWNYRTEETA